MENGHSIINLFINSSINKQGFFTENRGTIKNLNIYGRINSNNSNYIGGICSVNKFGVIENCSSNIVITGNSSYVGGIAGLSQGRIINCLNNSEINGFNFIGGIVRI